jgi:hypothetical protein
MRQPELDRLGPDQQGTATAVAIIQSNDDSGTVWNAVLQDGT